MRLTLNPHPDCFPTKAIQVEVDVARPGAGELVLHYFVTGAIADLRLPPVMACARRDELWQHTCFEAFIRALGDDAYHEFNFAPSTEWAAYRFSGYRSGMSVATGMDLPRIETRSSGDCYELRSSLTLHHLPGDAAWRLGLSAVIEEMNGRKSYWALAHPPGKADFHHPDCFVHELPGI